MRFCVLFVFMGILLVNLTGCGSSGGGSGGGGSNFRTNEQANILSVDSDSNLGNGHSRFAVQSDNGRFVAFSSAATNLVVGDTNGEYDVFVRDRANDTTTRVSVSSAAAEAVGGDSENPSINDDGNLIVFESEATNLVAGDTNSDKDIFMHNTDTGTSIRISTTTTGLETTDDSRNAKISGDGEWIVFETDASLQPSDTNNVSDIYLYEIDTGTISRISENTNGTQSNGVSRNPSLSVDGRYIVFESAATTLISGDTNGVYDIFLYDRTLDTLERVNLTIGNTQSTGASYKPSVSDDGNRVLFESDATDLIGAFNDTNSSRDIFVRLRNIPSTARVSVNSAGVQSNGDSTNASISRDGANALFQSLATTLVDDDTNGVSDVFLRGIDAASTQRLSLNRSSLEGNGASYNVNLCATTRYATFHTEATNMDTFTDDNGVDDIVAVPVATP